MSRLHKRYMVELIGEIVSGVYPAGGLLPGEVELVERYGVSRGVVRECLRGLEERGLVAVRHGKGALIRPQEEWDLFDTEVLTALVESGQPTGLLAEYLECRKLLEVQGAGLAAQRATPDQRKDLADSFDRLARMAREGVNNPRLENQYHEADINFHRVLAAASGNRALAHLVHEVHRSLIPRQILARPAGRHDVILAEHERILRAVEDGDGDEARAAMADHLTALEDYLAAHEAELDPPEAPEAPEADSDPGERSTRSRRAASPAARS